MGRCLSKSGRSRRWRRIETSSQKSLKLSRGNWHRYPVCSLGRQLSILKWRAEKKIGNLISLQLSCDNAVSEESRMKAVLSLVLVLSGWLAAALAEESPSPLGKKIDNFHLRDYRGAERSLQDFSDREIVVLAFMGTECPVAKLYTPRLAE